MDRADWERALAIYIPMAAAVLARLLYGKRPKQFAACLLAIVWTLPALLVVQRLNSIEHWWSYAASDVQFRGMPVELLIGWTLLWGLVPQTVLPRLGVASSAAVMVAGDCIGMPLCRASVHLGREWLVGELVAVAVVLLPAQCLARWTQEGRHLKARATLQVAASGMLFLFFFPEVCFALKPGAGWAPLLELPSWLRQLGIQAVLCLAVPGIGAVFEFVERGNGTPIPYDPPQRLVTSGIYRYVANPMQASCAAVMLAWAGMLRNGWLLAGAAASIVYSAGIAEWDERGDLSRRFGKPWREYRSQVKNWLPRWRPYYSGPPATLYIARSCQACSQVRRWIEAHAPNGIRIVDAESLPHGSIERMRYDPGDGSAAADGIRALGRALEHLHLGWALAGTFLRLPLIWNFIQLLMDASGLGPRTIPGVKCELTNSR